MGEDLSQEIEEKAERLRRLISLKRLDGIVLLDRDNISWFTCGIYDRGPRRPGWASVLVTRPGRYFAGYKADILDIADELELQGFDLIALRWSESSPLARVTERLRGLKLGCDRPFPGFTELSEELTQARYPFLETEAERYRFLCAESGFAVKDALDTISAGISELDVYSELVRAFHRRGIELISAEVAADLRAFSLRHTAPSVERIHSYLFVRALSRWRGLNCAISRSICFGDVPRSLARRFDVAMKGWASMVLSTRAGVRFRDILEAGRVSYQRNGMMEEWASDFPAGPAGYISGRPAFILSKELRVAPGQPLTWSAVATGTRVEDAGITGPGGLSVISICEGWPTRIIEMENGSIAVADMAVRER